MRCIEKLSELLTARQPDETILLVQSADEGRRLITECARRGRLLVGVRAATPLALAKEICAPVLVGKDAPRVLARGEMEDLFFETLMEMPEDGFFTRPHVRGRKAAEMLLDTVNELDRELVPPPGGNERLDAVRLLRERWQARRGDTLLSEADLLHLAISLVESGEQGQAFADTSFVVLSTACFPALDRKLIRVLTGDSLTICPVEVPENARIPGRCIGAAGSEIPIAGERLRFWRCRGMETEQKAVLRDILDAGKMAEDCAIVYMSADYVPGLYAAAKSFHLPIAMEEGIPMTDSTVYDVLRIVQEWALSDYNAEKLRRLILSGALRMQAGKRFCHELRKRNIGWGKARYERMLQPDEDGFPNRETAESWRKTLDLLFRVSEKTGSMEEQKCLMRQLLENAVGVGREEDALALAMAKNLLAQISWLEEGETIPDRLTELVSQTSASTGVKEAGSILAVPLSHAFCTGRKTLYFCGLSRFSMQNGTEESPILLDEERLRLGLSGRQEREAETAFRFLLCLAQHEGVAVLSYNDYDMERMNALSPAPVYRSLLTDGEAEVISCIPETPLIAGDFASTGKPICIFPVNEDEAKNVDGDCADVETAAPEDIGEQGTPFALREASSYEDTIEGMAFSASSMETALSCPFKFYMQRLVGLYPPLIPERRNDSWLEANEMGTLCHAVLEQYYRNPESGWESILDAEIEKLKELRPEGPASGMQADREKARRMIWRAISWSRETGREVLSTEKAFGKNAGENPLSIRVGERTLRLNGSIDRVDSQPDGTLAILDYKTGGSGSYRDSLEVKLQQYLYTLAAESMEPEQKVAEGGYLFLRDAADYLRVPMDGTERARKERTITSLLDWMAEEERMQIAAPAFEMTDGTITGLGDANARKKQFEKCSRYCEFAALCPAAEQIRIQAEAEGREVSADV